MGVLVAAFTILEPLSQCFALLYPIFQLPHGIKLYPAVSPNAPSGAPPPVSDTDTPVVSETYDEVVFSDPTEVFYKQLLQVSELPVVHLKEDRVQGALKPYSDEQQFLALLEAKKFLERELVTVKSRFQLVESESKLVDAAIREVQERNKTRKAQRGTAASKKQKT